MSFAVTVDIDVAKPLLLLRNGQKRLAYALVNSLNKTAKDVQAAEQAKVFRTFTVRKREFIKREAAIVSFASVAKTRYEASIRVGQKPRLLLSRYEKGGQRSGFVGKNVAVPALGGARPSRSSPIPESLLVQRLRLRRQRPSKSRRRTEVAGGRQPFKGLQRTYQISGVGIIQRTGPSSTRILYPFVPHVRLAPELGFIVTGTAVARRSFQRHLRAEVRQAFNRAAGPLAGAIVSSL